MTTRTENHQPPAAADDVEHYDLTVSVDGQQVNHRSLPDPLHHTLVEVRLSWLECLRGVLTGGHTTRVRLNVSADRVGLWRLFSSHCWEPPGLLDQQPRHIDGAEASS